MDGKYPQNATDCLISVPSYYPFPRINGTSWGSEDCLFLDVKVPEGVRAGDNVSVLHWFYGSGVRIRISFLGYHDFHATY
jgi:carboxylesterase type B